MHLCNSYLPYIYGLKLLFRFESDMGTARHNSQICQIILYQNVCVKFVAHGCPFSCAEVVILICYLFIVYLTNYDYLLQLFIANLNIIFILLIYYADTQRVLSTIHKIVD